MRFNVEEWKNRSKQDFDKAWHEGPSILTPSSHGSQYPRLAYRHAKAHPVFSIIQRLRETYLSLGFDEVCNPIMVEEQDVYKQFGPEAMAVLDRVFYLGGLPRPNVGISRLQIEKIGEILGKEVAGETEEKLRETLHGYKKATIDGDDLVHELAQVLAADDGMVVHILDTVFPEFKALAPESSRTTLRSHMTSGWFITLGAVWEHRLLPLKLFSVDRCFRREQQEGPTRLMTYHSASCVVAGEDVSNEEGKAVSEALLSAFGFTEFKFKLDEKRSKYYMPNTQTEVYVHSREHEWVEIATFGLYSPSALSEYGIAVPVMNLGLGVERLATIVYGVDDVRTISYPQFYPQIIGDHEIARSIKLRQEPTSSEGRGIAAAISTTARSNAMVQGPCSFKAWSGQVAGTRLDVFVEEREPNSKLCGPACFNEVFVLNGSILGIPDNEKWREVRKSGISTNIGYIDAVGSLAAAKIEAAAMCKSPITVQVKMARSPADINIYIEDYVMRFITDNKKKIDVRGPVFLTVRSEIRE